MENKRLEPRNLYRDTEDIRSSRPKPVCRLPSATLSQLLLAI